ncbi:hypothetical protein MMPV_001517 [Pyropia vietnamensis]
MTQPPAETFEAAAALVSAGVVSPPQPTLLRLYGLYAVATRGPCSGAPPPPLWDVRGRAKHGAYAAASAEGLSVDTARAAYVALVASLPRSGEGGKAAAGGEPPPPPPPTGLGAKGSTGFVVGATEVPGVAAEEVPPPAGVAAAAELPSPPLSATRPPSPPIDLGHWAALGDTASARYVLEGHPSAAAAAAAVNTPDEEGLTPLMRAADRGHAETVALLLAAGADPAVTDGEGWTALTYAGDCGWPDVAAALVAAGATGWDEPVRTAVAAAERGEWSPAGGESSIVPVPRLKFGRREGGGQVRARGGLLRRLLWSPQALAHAMVVGVFLALARRRRRD